jgi:hypothetical protein
MSSYIADVKESPDGELYIEFTDEIIKEVGWKEGDVLNWKDNKDGSFTLTKKETQWVLVDCINTFRTRYMVEVPIGTDQFGKDKTEWALDTVTMGDAKEFSQHHVGEQIVSHRVVTKEEALSLCKDDNDYCISWNDETKMKNFFTLWEEQNGTD